MAKKGDTSSKTAQVKHTASGSIQQPGPHSIQATDPLSLLTPKTPSQNEVKSTSGTTSS